MNEFPNKPYLMVIDDTAFAKSHINSDIKKNYHIVYENEGKNALKIIKDHQPVVYLIQLMLSQMDSLELCQRIRSIPHNQRPLITIISNTPYSKSIHDVVLKNGADHILFPPIDDQVLESLILKRPYALSS
jgi:PleD family two-component response regulator